MTIRRLFFTLGFIGIVLALSLALKPSKIPLETTMIAPPPLNPYHSAVAANGIVEAYGNNVIIGSPVTGVVQKVYVTVGDIVKKGQSLFTIDDRDFKTLLTTSEAAVQVADAQVVKAKNQLDRRIAVSDPRAVSTLDLQNAEADFTISKAQVVQSHAQVERAKILLDRQTVYAPKDGVVLACDVREGEYLSQENSTRLILLGVTDPLQVRLDIDEENASRIRPGAPAVAYTKSFDRRPLPIEFDHIEPYVIPKKSLTGSSDERVDTRVLQVIYKLKPLPDYPVYVGQQIDAFIEAPPLKRVQVDQANSAQKNE